MPRVFFFQRGSNLFLVTSRHVVTDENSGHFPDRLVTELHTDAENLAKSVGFSIPLYSNGMAVWRQYSDNHGLVDIAVLKLDRKAMPESTVLYSFTPKHLPRRDESISAGTRLLISGFPLGFHDTLHHMGVVRHATLASAWNLRFQGQGIFLTDGRTHRGSSGAPVVMHAGDWSRIPDGLPYLLLGVHSSRFDIGTRDTTVDEALGLNCAWYADVLMHMTK